MAARKLLRKWFTSTRFSALVVAASVVTTLGLASATGALAQSTCKGLQRSSCERNETCSWVSAYETKAGKQVKAHCRSIPQKSKIMKSG